MTLLLVILGKPGTAPNEMPIFVHCEAKFCTEVNKALKPIPPAPNSSAMNLLRTRPIRMTIPCTPPNIHVYFSTWS